MTFDEIVEIADEAYPDGLIKQGGGSGDGLAKFIYQELKETYDAAASEEVQIKEAIRVMWMARRELEAVEYAFRNVRRINHEA